MTNLDSVLKNRDITFLTKIHLVKAMVFPGDIYGYESWTITKAEWALNNWCFQIVVLEKTLECSLDSKEIKSVNLKGNQPWIFIGRNWCWSWSSNTLATWCKELPHWKNPYCWERLSAEGERGNRGWDGWIASSTQWTSVWLDSGIWWWTGRPGMLWFMGSQSWTRLSDWTVWDSIFKSRDTTLSTSVRLVKVMVFPVVMYGYENRTIKQAEHWIVDAFELWCWRRLLRVPWPAKRSSQSILKEISPENTLEGLVLKLKL